YRRHPRSRSRFRAPAPAPARTNRDGDRRRLLPAGSWTNSVFSGVDRRAGTASPPDMPLASGGACRGKAGRMRRSGRDEFEGDAVDAIAQAGGRRAVLEDMALVAAAIGAVHLDALHAQCVVDRGAQGPVDEGIEARPAGAALELGVGGEERLLAAGAMEGAGAMLVIERGAVGIFRGLV